jgi:hypothetical protein
MENPWARVPHLAPFVLPDDEPYVAAFNGTLDEGNTAHYLDTKLPPGPFAGHLDAPVVILLANPGWDERDQAEQCGPDPLGAILKAITVDGGTPAWPLTDRFAHTAAGQWWRTRTRDLAEAMGGFDFLAVRLLMIELHGYHSREWVAPLVTFPSQHFGFNLVHAAMDRGALIVVGRCSRYWHAAVPGLREYENKIGGLASSRSAHLSRGNLKDEFDKVVAALGGHAGHAKTRL